MDQSLRRKKSLLLRVSFLLVCCLCVNVSFSQCSLPIWQEYFERAKNEPYKEFVSDADFLHLVGYTYRGAIKTEAEKAVVIDSLLSDYSIALLKFPPIVVRDTIVTDSSREFREQCFPRFEFITKRVIAQLAQLEGLENPFIQLRVEFEEMIKVGFEVVELEWGYKKSKYRSLCIVSNENGNILYEEVTNGITTAISTTKESIVGRSNR